MVCQVQTHRIHLEFFDSHHACRNGVFEKKISVSAFQSAEGRAILEPQTFVVPESFNSSDLDIDTFVGKRSDAYPFAVVLP